MTRSRFKPGQVVEIDRSPWLYKGVYGDESIDSPVEAVCKFKISAVVINTQPSHSEASLVRWVNLILHDGQICHAIEAHLVNAMEHERNVDRA